VSGRLRHTSTAAGRTKAAALAGEGQQFVGATAIASKASETVGQDSALEVASQFANDVAGKWGTGKGVLGSTQKGF
jgi:hypothetical protein